MTDINLTDIKLMASQRLDDTDEGGGQMTADEIVDGNVNNLFPDISRLDRVYGRVSMRKAFLAIRTANRATYYGSHAIITEQAKDPNVGITMFSTEDWFDTREDARNRIESFLVKGPQLQGALWGNHYTGARAITLFTDEINPAPKIGDVIVLVKNAGLSTEVSQYVRIQEVSSEIKTLQYFVGTSILPYKKLIVTITMGEMLIDDFPGVEIFPGSTYKNSGPYPIGTILYTTVTADASRYYGVDTLQDAAESGDMSIRVNSIMAPLIPSANSETGIVDATVGNSVANVVQTKSVLEPISRSIAFSFAPNGQLYLGEGIWPKSLLWSGGVTLTDDGEGGIYSGATEMGSIDYTTGVIAFGSAMGTYSGTGRATYSPACAPMERSETGSIMIESANRGFVYTYSCNPPPVPRTLRIDFFAGGKWYTLRDRGNGRVVGTDPSLGSASINYVTGSVNISLGYMPDIDSVILLFWGRSVLYSDLSGDNVALIYPFSLGHQGVNKGSVLITWIGDANGPGPDGRYGVIDDTDGHMSVATYSGGSWIATATDVGWVRYANGVGEFSPGSAQYVPLSSELFTISYSYGQKLTETFTGVSRNPDTTVTLNLANTPVIPGSLHVSWVNKWMEFDPTQEMIGSSNAYRNEHMPSDGITQVNTQTGEVTMQMVDDGAGNLKVGPSVVGTINYTTGVCTFQPNKTVSVPMIQYNWVAENWT